MGTYEAGKEYPFTQDAPNPAIPQIGAYEEPEAS